MMEKLKGYRSKFEELKDKNTAFFQKFYTEEILLAFLIVFVTIILLSGGYFNSFFTFIFFWVFVAYFIVTIWSVRKTLLINSVLIRRPETWVLAIVSVLLILMLYPLGYSRFQWIFYLIFIGANLETAIYYDQKKSMNERFLEHKDPKYEAVRNDTRQILHEMKDTESKLEREVNDRLKAERLRSELITNISHDIRTPLTSIINFTKLLSNEETTAVGKDYLGVIDKSAQRMKVMVEDLFEATKSSTGNIEVEMGNIDFSEILMQVYAPLHNSFTDKNIELVYNRVDRSVSVWADGKYLMRVIQNLLVNARKYSVENTRVYIKVKEVGEKVEVSFVNVSRDKLDISPDELMEQFVRADKSRTEEGSGLGLYIAQNLIKSMQGELKLSIEGDVFTSKIILNKGIQEEFK